MSRPEHNKQDILSLLEQAKISLKAIPVLSNVDRETNAHKDKVFTHLSTKEAWKKDLEELTEAIKQRLDTIFGEDPDWKKLPLDTQEELHAIVETIQSEITRINSFTTDSDYYLHNLCEAEKRFREKAGDWAQEETKRKYIQAKLETILKKSQDIVNNELKTLWHVPNLKTLGMIKTGGFVYLTMFSTILNTSGYGKKIGDLQYYLFVLYNYNFSHSNSGDLLKELTLFIANHLEKALDTQTQKAKSQTNTGAAAGVDEESEMIRLKELFQQLISHFPQLLLDLAETVGEEHNYLKNLAKDTLRDDLKLDDGEDILFSLFPIQAAKKLINKEFSGDKEALISSLNSVFENLGTEIRNSKSASLSPTPSEENLTTIIHPEGTKQEKKISAKQDKTIQDARKVAKMHFQMAQILCDTTSTPDVKRKAINHVYYRSTSLFERLAEVFRALAEAAANAFTFKMTIEIQLPKGHSEPSDESNTDDQSIASEHEASETDVDKKRTPQKPISIVNNNNVDNSAPALPQQSNNKTSPTLFFHSPTQMKKHMRDMALESLETLKLGP